MVFDFRAAALLTAIPASPKGRKRRNGKEEDAGDLFGRRKALEVHKGALFRFSCSLSCLCATQMHARPARGRLPKTYTHGRNGEPRANELYR